MELIEALYNRQSVGKVKAEPLPQALIEKLLDAAAQAPNHYKVRPWRFIIITGAARERLGEVMAQSLAAQNPAANDEALAAERAKPLRAPLIIAIGVEPPAEPKVLEIENICAAAAAAQNLLLAAHALGLAAIWRTGPSALDPQVKTFLGLAPSQHLIALIYAGYPEFEKPPAARPGFADRSTWLT